jgi:hypothetical protein
MKRIKNFFVSLAVMAVTHAVYAIAFGLRQIVKFVGLDPDVSPYQKHLAHMQQAFAQNHESPYDSDFDIQKYRRNNYNGDRPSFKFKTSETSSLKVTENPATQDLLKIAKREQALEDTRPKLKDLVAKIKKAGEIADKPVKRQVKSRTKLTKKIKKISKKAA